MAFKQLSKEDIKKISQSIKKPRVPDDFVKAVTLSQRLIFETYQAIARKAEQERDKQWLEWGGKLCVEHRHMDLSISHLRRYCPECWQERKAEEEG